MKVNVVIPTEPPPPEIHLVMSVAQARLLKIVAGAHQVVAPVALESNANHFGTPQVTEKDLNQLLMDMERKLWDAGVRDNGHHQIY